MQRIISENVHDPAITVEQADPPGWPGKRVHHKAVAARGVEL